jgi:GNAT superfamily N-acetyltransferase
MMKICQMTVTEYEVFINLSMQDHIRSQILARNWTEEFAVENMKQLRLQMLPDGMATPDHYFYALKDESEKQVGGLWFMVQSNENKRFIFVVDIQIYKEFRRRGYGSGAFGFLEAKAVEMGIDQIYLNVFEHNVTARWMYEKLGYSGENELMMKQLS